MDDNKNQIFVEINIDSLIRDLLIKITPFKIEFTKRRTVPYSFISELKWTEFTEKKFINLYALLIKKNKISNKEI